MPPAQHPHPTARSNKCSPCVALTATAAGAIPLSLRAVPTAGGGTPVWSEAVGDTLRLVEHGVRCCDERLPRVSLCSDGVRCHAVRGTVAHRERPEGAVVARRHVRRVVALVAAPARSQSWQPWLRWRHSPRLRLGVVAQEGADRLERPREGSLVVGPDATIGGVHNEYQPKSVRPRRRARRHVWTWACDMDLGIGIGRGMYGVRAWLRWSDSGRTTRRACTGAA